MTQVACFVSIFLQKGDGTKGIQTKIESILVRHGGAVNSIAIGKGGRRVTIHTTIDPKKGESEQQTIDRVCDEITDATGRTTVGRPEGWNPRKN